MSPPVATGLDRQRTPGYTETRGLRPAASRKAGKGPRSVSWLLPLTLLIILGLAGLRGVVVTPRWNGPLHQDGVAIGIALEAVLIALLTITFGRRAAAARAQTYNAVAVKLREILILTLIAAMIGVVIAVVIGVHLYLFTPKTRPNNTATVPAPTLKVPRPGSQHPATLHISTAALLWALIIVVLLAAVVLSVWWARRFAMPAGGREDGLIAEDSEDLREAVDRAGRRCAPSTTRGRPSSPATWPWRPAWPRGARPGRRPTRPTSCWPGPPPAASCAAPRRRG